MVAKGKGIEAWEHFPHGADVGIRGVGGTLEAAFEQAALAMTAVMIDPSTVNPDTKVAVSCEAPDPELLLVDWLNALVYEMAVRRMLFSRFKVRIEVDRLSGSAWGESVDPEKHSVAVEVKGATYTALRVSRGGDGVWRAQCVVDV